MELRIVEPADHWDAEVKVTDCVFSAAFERLAVLSHRMSGALASVDEKRCPTRYRFKGHLSLHLQTRGSEAHRQRAPMKCNSFSSNDFDNQPHHNLRTKKDKCGEMTSASSPFVGLP